MVALLVSRPVMEPGPSEYKFKALPFCFSFPNQNSMLSVLSYVCVNFWHITFITNFIVRYWQRSNDCYIDAAGRVSNKKEGRGLRFQCQELL
jgi:hypothetical protein